MKTKIISILIGMGIMGVLVGCGQSIKNVKADKNGYLKYCGSQSSIFGHVDLAVYEDSEHNNVIYVTTDNNGHAIATTAVPKH
jgi:hypothetical protein